MDETTQSYASGGDSVKYEEYWPPMMEDALACLGVKYKFGSEAILLGDFPPQWLDCSEFIEILHARRKIPCPDGARYQWTESHRVEKPRPGDLGFIKRQSAIGPDNPHGIVHVDMLLDDKWVIGARGKPYNKVVKIDRAMLERNVEFIAAGGWRRLNVLRDA